MVRVTLYYVFAWLVFVSCHGSWQLASAQEFPYSVPKAPEFDHRGNYLGHGSDAPPSQERSSRNGGQEQASQERSYYTAVRPYAPQAPVPPQGLGPAPQVQQVPRPQRIRATASTPPPPQPEPQPQQMQQPPDCTGYPMAIARARSQGEMQMIARQYLTCLLKTGWPQDRAREQVIRTIESTYAVTR
jgi:hypothetical protein